MAIVTRSVVAISPEEHAERMERVKRHLRQWLLSLRPADVGGIPAEVEPVPIDQRALEVEASDG